MDRQGEGLKECPFCGCYKEEKNKPIFIKSIEGWFKVECPICQANKSYHSTKQGAINEWNTRPPSPAKEPKWPDKKDVLPSFTSYRFGKSTAHTINIWNQCREECIKAWKDSL